LEEEPDPNDTVSMRFIKHLEAQIVELKAEVEYLRGRTEPALSGAAEAVDFKPMGGFRPRHAVAKSIKLEIAKRKRAEREKEIS